MRYIIVDLEATCWEGNRDTTRMETIEIGAIALSSSSARPNAEYNRFIRPVKHPILSDFCKQLTSIRQDDVDKADYFSTVFPDFLAWIGDDDFTLCSWGAYDARQLRQDCVLHGITYPATFELHINLKRTFARWKGIKPCGMSAALELMKIPLEGQHHRAIDDVRNIAKLARYVLPELEQRPNDFL